jgi:hypothetical protein
MPDTVIRWAGSTEPRCGGRKVAQKGLASSGRARRAPSSCILWHDRSVEDEMRLAVELKLEVERELARQAAARGMDVSA